MEIIYNYIKSVGYFMVFSSAVRLLVPKNGFRAYVDMLLGFIFIIIILSPIKGVISGVMPGIDGYIIEKGAEIGRELYNSADYENSREIIKEEQLRLVKDRTVELCKGYVEDAAAEVTINDDFETEGLYIEGKVIADTKGLKKALSLELCVDEENIEIYGEENR